MEYLLLKKELIKKVFGKKEFSLRPILQVIPAPSLIVMTVWCHSNYSKVIVYVII